MATARQGPAEREGMAKGWENDNGFGDDRGNGGREAATSAGWAAGRGIAGVVWTNLPWKFDGKDTKPSGEQVVSFLRTSTTTRGPLQKRTCEKPRARSTHPIAG